MSSELTDAEKAFVQKIRNERDFSSEEKKKRRFGSGIKLHLRLFGVVFLALGLGGAALTVSVFNSIYDSYGSTSAQTLVNELSSSSSGNNILDYLNLSWLPYFLDFYPYRWVLALALFGVFLVLALVVFAMDAKRRDE